MADAQLDNDIAAIRAQIRKLTHRRSTLVRQSTTTTISTSHHQTLLSRLTTPVESVTTSTTISDPTPLLSTTFSRTRKQALHNQECLYRMAAGATMFEVKDPDPYAVDKGRVFGVRIEVFTSGKFQNPYYIFLTRNPTTPPTLRLHRHTLPPHIPLTSLLATHLPQPAPPPSEKPPPPQSLPLLIRALRRYLVSHHLRVSSISSLRASLGLTTSRSREKQRAHRIKALEMSDVEGKDVRILWTDGRVGRVRISISGVVDKCVVIGAEGREREVERIVMGGNRRIEGLGERLRRT